ncbi:MAG: hypothetical protein HZA77_08200 [Candidatus Schekmanbacteria bacterium]|nr:hypothetical protein [Candidatus Schekmanbacteria bacterium]
MDNKQAINYWIKSAEADWQVVNHLFEKRDYTYALFFGQIALLETITDFNLEARYPDERFLFKKKCTKKFTAKYIAEIEYLKQWLLKQIQS